MICKIGVFCSPGIVHTTCFWPFMKCCPHLGDIFGWPLPVTVTRRFLAVVVTFRNYSVEHCPNKLGCHYLADRPFAWIHPQHVVESLGRVLVPPGIYCTQKHPLIIAHAALGNKKSYQHSQNFNKKGHIKLHPRYLGKYIYWSHDEFVCFFLGKSLWLFVSSHSYALAMPQVTPSTTNELE